MIGSRDRWARRLAGLAAELRLQRAGLEAEGGAHLAAIDRQLIDLDHLRDAALPLIDALAALPRAAPWNDWLGHLRTLARRAIRDREPILAALAELDPMGPVGPVTLDEVRLVLGDRLGQLNRAPARRRYGAVFVGPAAALRGLEFGVVIVPGLVERVFPRKLVEDPILADAARRALSPALATQADRVGAERLALRLAVGAARQRVVFSYPRVDLDQGRPRVPSFYALEILRAAEGRLPGFDELARRAAGEHPGRLGWPAPARPADAIDEAEAFLPSFGSLGIGGVVALVIGLLILFDPDIAAGYRLPYSFIATFAAASATLTFATVWFALKARRRPVVSGSEDIIGAGGAALADFEREGWAQVRGETWRVVSAAPLARGERLRVTGIEGLTLRVEPESKQGGAS